MKVQVLAFATASDVLGSTPHTLTLNEGATLGDLRAALLTEHPALEAIWPRLAVAVDGDLVRDHEAHPLRDGTEVALLPPVSGGKGDEPPAATCLVDEPIDVAAVERTVRAADCGAVLLFLGTVRNHHAGRAVDGLDYSAYRPMAERALRRIVAGIEGDADAPLRLVIVHRLGDVPVGEASVVIAAASPHRDAAYQASRTALERLKREVPIWKREHYASGDVVWREEEPLGT